MFNYFKKEKQDNKEQRTPDGLTHDEFVKKYDDTPHIAGLCWALGVRPEELKKELELLLNK